MILQKLFLPPNLFAQQSLGIEISKNAIFATQLKQRGQAIYIQKTITVALETNETINHEESIVEGLKQVLKQTQGSLCLAIPNHQVFFKELTIPFLEAHKIKLVLGYELEAAIPFPLAEAVFDFIITNQDLSKKVSTILVAITKKDQLDYYLNLMAQANQKIQLQTMTIDLFGAYNLFTQLYKERDQYQILLDLGKNSITIAALQQGDLKLVRNLPYGMNSLINQALSPKKTYKEVVENLLRFGLADVEKTVLESFTKFTNDLNFTYTSFQSQLPNLPKIERVLIVESALEIKDLAEFLHKQTNLKYQTFSLNKIYTQKEFTIAAGVHLDPAHLVSLGSALKLPKTSEFNLASQLDSSSQRILQWQLTTLFSLTLILFLGIYGLGWFKTSDLNEQLLSYRQQALTTLKKRFVGLKAKDLTSAINASATQVNNEKHLWFSFSNQTHYRYLDYLQALSEALNKYQVHLDLKKLTIIDNELTLQGSVDRYEELDALEQALQSSLLFVKFTKPVEKVFTIKVTLKTVIGEP